MKPQISRGAHRTLTVPTNDGVPLIVHDYGPTGAPLTLVFVHGHCLRAAAWEFQLAHLKRLWGSDIRMVAYDQRGHGESGHSSMDTYTIDRLGRDLQSVLQSLSCGPTILIGHSMGGMAALAYIRQNPQAPGTHVVGMALISTSAGDLSAHGLGRSLNSPLLGLARIAVAHTPGIAGVVRKAGQYVCRPLIHGAGYGTHVTGQMRTIGTAMLSAVELDTMVGYLQSLKQHDERIALELIRTIPIAVICGSIDLMTPPVHSHAVAEGLADGELTIIDRAGHMVIHERPAQVSAIISRLVDRVTTVRVGADAALQSTR